MIKKLEVCHDQERFWLLDVETNEEVLFIDYEEDDLLKWIQINIHAIKILFNKIMKN